MHFTLYILSCILRVIEGKRGCVMTEYLMIVAVFTVPVLVLEIIMGRHKGVYKKEEFLVLLGSFFLGRNFVVPLVTALIAGLYLLFFPQYKGALGHVSFLLAYPVLLLVDEFCFYWVHRWAHVSHHPENNSLLWKMHRTHHAGKYMNVLLNCRVNLSWFLVVPTAWVNGLALYLGMFEVVAVNMLVKMGWNLITHSNFRWDDGVRSHRLFGPIFRALEHVVVSPGIHHTHHGYGRDGANYKNFGVVLSLYDWIFGTLHIPQGRPSKYGLPGKNAHWLEELFYPVVRIGAKAPSK